MQNIIALILIILPLSVFSETQTTQIPKFDLSTPQRSMNYFLKSMKAHKLGDINAINLAIKTMDLSQLNPSSRETSGKIAAQNLIQTLDRIEYIDIKKIPDTREGDNWIYRKTKVTWENEQYDVEIAMSQNKDKQWQFTSQTVASIFYYYKTLQKNTIVKGVKELRTWKDEIKSRLPDWTGNRSIILLNGQWLGLFLIIFIAILLRFFIKIYISRFMTKLFAQSKLIYNDKTRKTLSFPIGLATFSGIWTVGIGMLEFNDKILSYLLRAGYVGFTIGLVATVYFLVDILKIYLEKVAKDSENKFDDILVPLVTKTLKTFVVLIGIIFIGNSLTLDMKSLLAGMGIGGIAFALAAKDTISNIFGSLTVLLDRPFRIGDWVLIDGNIEGSIQEVGLRSTRIRTFYDSIISLPNGRLTNAHIDNYGQRTYRRLSTKLGVQYDTPPEKLEAFCEGIRQLIANHEYTRKDSFHVYFTNFGDSALEVLLYVFWKVPDWSSELNEKHRLLMDILRLGNEMGVQFAFPTQTIHMHQEEKSKVVSDLKVDEEMANVKILSQQLSQNTITHPSHRSSTLDLK